jgi:hypothetical protein
MRSPSAVFCYRCLFALALSPGTCAINDASDNFPDVRDEAPTTILDTHGRAKKLKAVCLTACFVIVVLIATAGWLYFLVRLVLSLATWIGGENQDANKSTIITATKIDAAAKTTVPKNGELDFCVGSVSVCVLLANQ